MWSFYIAVLQRTIKKSPKMYIPRVERFVLLIKIFFPASKLLLLKIAVVLQRTANDLSARKSAQF